MTEHAAESRAARARQLKGWLEESGVEVTRLARHAGIKSRQTVYRALEGTASDATYDKLEAARDYITAHPHDEPDEPQAVVSTERGIVEVELTDVFGAGRVAIRGQMSPELEEFVERVIDRLRKGHADTDQ